jgi:hypothetical protein
MHAAGLSRIRTGILIVVGEQDMTSFNRSAELLCRPRNASTPRRRSSRPAGSPLGASMSATHVARHS